MQEQAPTELSGQALLTKKDVVSRNKVCERTVNYWIKRGWLPYIKLGRNVRFLAADVDHFIRSHRIGG